MIFVPVTELTAFIKAVDMVGDSIIAETTTTATRKMKYRSLVRTELLALPGQQHMPQAAGPKQQHKRSRHILANLV